MPTGVYPRKPLSEETKRKISEKRKGFRWTESQKEKISLATKEAMKNPSIRKIISDYSKKKIGKLSGRWKGYKAGYYAKHSWIIRWHGKPKKCEYCGKDNLEGKNIHWANKDHKYKRDRKDWIRLCAKCHRQYDIENNDFYRFLKSRGLPQG